MQLEQEQITRRKRLEIPSGGFPEVDLIRLDSSQVIKPVFIRNSYEKAMIGLRILKPHCYKD